VYVPRFELSGFDVLTDADKCRAVLLMVKGLVEINRIEWRAASPPPPPLYESGVVYACQGEQDDWKDLVRVLETGAGSCNSLVAWRVAELLENGVDAGPFIKTAVLETPEGPFDQFHVVCWIGQRGNFEDPSALLGMPPTCGV
jgi:hypothetical protein